MVDPNTVAWKIKWNSHVTWERWMSSWIVICYLENHIEGDRKSTHPMPNHVYLSDVLQTQNNGNVEVVGKLIRLEGTSCVTCETESRTLVGIMPRGYSHKDYEIRSSFVFLADRAFS